MCPSLCASMYTAPVYKGWPSSSFSVQGVSKFVHMLCTNWTLAWAHVYISKQFPSLGTPTSTAVNVSFLFVFIFQLPGIPNEPSDLRDVHCSGLYFVLGSNFGRLRGNCVSLSLWASSI